MRHPKLSFLALFVCQSTDFGVKTAFYSNLCSASLSSVGQVILPPWFSVFSSMYCVAKRISETCMCKCFTQNLAHSSPSENVGFLLFPSQWLPSLPPPHPLLNLGSLEPLCSLAPSQVVLSSPEKDRNTAPLPPSGERSPLHGQTINYTFKLYSFMNQMSGLIYKHVPESSAIYPCN